MQDNLNAVIVQNLISTVLTCDVDGDLVLSNAEIDDAIAKLESIHGVQLKEDKLRDLVISQGRSLHAILQVIRNLLLSDGDQEDSIFSFIEE